ncbi:thiamine-phosphate kinase [Kordiimonas aestuarii]|uniref:thiamine-phosphate kinase n=1 Tax=Kordiimonas aestuarii TaxID=1005925 RepID=UPI0021CE446B|nr:thiamine-phosphate kinase [Kordiimonas aestuarii]
MAGEFDLIAKYFAPLAGPEGLGLTDDAACLSPQPGKSLIVTKDVIVGGVHFFDNDTPGSIAHKALAVNLSDLAAKGAIPKCYFLGLCLPRDIDEIWLSSFASGLKKMQEEYGITLAGGDTTSSPGPVMVSVTAMGDVPVGQMLRRNGAGAGDLVFVSGTLGDAALGLKCLLGELDPDDGLARRYHYPTPRTTLGPALVGLASASADISDGLLADLGHICETSRLGADIEEAKLPVSSRVRELVGENPDLAGLVYTGGDDYELVFTAPEEKRREIDAVAGKTGVRVTVVGRISDTAGIRLVDQNGELVQSARTGYQHFET